MHAWKDRGSGVACLAAEAERVGKVCWEQEIGGAKVRGKANQNRLSLGEYGGAIGKSQEMVVGQEEQGCLETPESLAEVGGAGPECN